MQSSQAVGFVSRLAAIGALVVAALSFANAAKPPLNRLRSRPFEITEDRPRCNNYNPQRHAPDLEDPVAGGEETRQRSQLPVGFQNLMPRAILVCSLLSKRGGFSPCSYEITRLACPSRSST